MKTMTIINLSRKHSTMGLFLRKLKSGDSPCYIISRDEEIFQIWLNDSIDQLVNFQPDALTWLDEHRYMLHEFSQEEGHTIAMTGFVEKEPNDGLMKNFKPSVE